MRCLARPGDRVERGQDLFELHTDTPDAVPAALAALDGGYTVADTDAVSRTGRSADERLSAGSADDQVSVGSADDDAPARTARGGADGGVVLDRVGPA